MIESEPRTQTQLFGLDKYITNLIELFENGKLPNKLLLSGQKGVGKCTLAYHLINYVLSKDEEFPYNLDNFEINSNNHSYKTLSNKSNINFFIIDITSDEKSIDINQIRELKTNTSLMRAQRNAASESIGKAKKSGENVSEIILKVTPLYNHYRKNKKTLQAYESIELMWDIGEILIPYIKKSKLSPHNLWRKIYGRSEGSVDNTKKSYITREFLGRCYRIYNMFEEKNEISKDFKRLKSFTSFREAMPFFDNPKYIFKGSDRKKLLNLLNSDLSSTKILNTIYYL